MSTVFGGAHEQNSIDFGLVRGLRHAGTFVVELMRRGWIPFLDAPSQATTPFKVEDPNHRTMPRSSATSFNDAGKGTRLPLVARRTNAGRTPSMASIRLKTAPAYGRIHATRREPAAWRPVAGKTSKH